MQSHYDPASVEQEAQGFWEEHNYFTVDAVNSLGKVVIVDTADKICHEIVSDLRINTGEDELK